MPEGELNIEQVLTLVEPMLTTPQKIALVALKPMIIGKMAELKKESDAREKRLIQCELDISNIKTIIQQFVKK